MNPALTNNIVLNKFRQELYLKHLRQVQSIKNREAEILKKELKQYRSINELHKKNKMFTKGWTTQQQSNSMGIKNHVINQKIHSIRSYVSFNEKLPDSPKERCHSLHYRYRKKQQEEIQLQNTRLMKGIASSRGTILPYLGRSSRFGRSRASERLNDSQEKHEQRQSAEAEKAPI